ncbi:FkbM family methyltransferase [Candidatus Methanoperedens nitratireducens]|uniref:FkbM family methyltransferase n=1 Tax=Candidatus Methanoperedens nitratireducens TaxID=1392998 RepID=UPI001177E3FF|nr:FkbM family methyltransferase [Candidatus Methanoperedens nitroreducens]
MENAISKDNEDYQKNIEVKVPTFWGGEMSVVLPEDVSVSIWRYGYFEEDVVRYMLRFLTEGMTFIDIGAHFGFFTLLGSYLVGKSGKVLAFEPTPTTYQQLKKNIVCYSNNFNIEIYNCAAFSKETEIKFFDCGLVNSAYNSIFGLRKTDRSSIIKNEITVKARKIDDVLKGKKFKNLNFIKIDAESSEIHVLKGMIETLKNYKPNIIIEVGDFEVHGVPKSKEIITWLEQMNYSPYEIHNGEIVSHIVRERYEYCNLLFLANK